VRKNQANLAHPGIFAAVAAWLARPYFRSRHRETPGELILLFAGIDRTCAAGLRPAPPEIVSCGFYHFDIDGWLRVPVKWGLTVYPLSGVQSILLAILNSKIG
jgi:hypothetical protein